MNDKPFVPAGHFYSPIPSPEEAQYAIERAMAASRQVPAGIKIDAEEMKRLWRQIAPAMATMPFGDHAGEKEHRYHYMNNMYSYGDASIYYGLVNVLQPKRIVEIGSGYSSALATDMREIFQRNMELTFIEPYPATLDTLLNDDDRSNVEIMNKKIQNVPLSVFDKLEANDILFIDSSHVAKIGSDVCFEIFDILPRLKPGVVVHFHDCFWPFEYPRRWVVDENRGWNELYFLRAFLMYNSRYEIIFFNSYFAMVHRDVAASFDTPFLKNAGGGLWLRRTADTTGK